jgi:glycosyltransferase involved in cell wall biosynthesis
LEADIRVMKVLYDYQIFESQKIGGISRYFAELIRHNPMAELSLKYSDNIYLHDEYFKKYRLFQLNYVHDNFFPNLNFKGKGRLFKYYTELFIKNNRTISIERLKKSNFDVFHPTYYNTYFLKYLKNKPFVVTVYDMIHELFPQYFKDDKFTVSFKQHLITQADIIIAISENTKKDILRFFPDLAEKIKVIYLGFSFEQLSKTKEKKNYILFTGSRGIYKNFDNFVRAIAPLLLKHNLRLVCTGEPFNNNEIILFNYLRITDKLIYIFASDNELTRLYSEAIAFVFPSLYEGFGIPILEAFSAGCPAILSNTSCFPEIAKGAAVYFDPYSVEDMRQVMEKVILGSSLRSELTRKGYERVKDFSWEETARQTYELYCEVLSTHNVNGKISSKV